MIRLNCTREELIAAWQHPNQDIDPMPPVDYPAVSQNYPDGRVIDEPPDVFHAISKVLAILIAADGILLLIHYLH